MVAEMLILAIDSAMVSHWRLRLVRSSAARQVQNETFSQTTKSGLGKSWLGLRTGHP
jgi:hypothetical protein